jgi:hypothetical protein
MDLAKLSIEELMFKAQRYEEKKALHAKRMNVYRLSHLEEYRAKAALLAKKQYWRKKGFELNDLGEKIPIQPIPIN